MRANRFNLSEIFDLLLCGDILQILIFKFAATLPIIAFVKLDAPSTNMDAGKPKYLIQFCTNLSTITLAVQSLFIGMKTEYREKTSIIVKKLSTRGGNNGGSWDPSSQKTFGLTENFQWNCRFFVVKINFWGKLQLFHWENEIFAKDITIFKHSNSNLMIISDVNTALSQKILGPDS